jgi:lysophospholipase L1-like esterase
MISLNENDTILFIGDSITDCGRNKELPEHLGFGYVNTVSARLGCDLAELNLKFINRGISGNRVADLEDRWQEDCLDHKPDILSIMIGLNNTWRRYDSNDITTPEVFRETYRRLLESAREKLNCQIIILESFLLPYPEDRKAWREDLDPKIDITRELAREFADAYVPLDGLFAAACCRCEPAHWAGDGVHPTMAGHTLIADAWLSFSGLS